MGKDAPEAPDPFATAQAQAQANTKAAEDTLRLNSINQYSPYGSSVFDKDAGGLPVSQTLSFAPAIQAAFDAQTATQGNVADFARTLSGQLPASAFSLADVPQGLDVASAIANQSFDAIRPEIDRNRDLLNIQLSERGIPIGAEISNDERDRFERGVNQTYADIGNQAVLAAQGEQQRQIQNALLERTQGINEIAAALQGGGALSTPNFAPQAQAGIGAADIAGLIQNNYAQQAAQYGQEQASKGNLIGAIGSAAVLSDRRLKRDIVEIGKGIHGLGVYLYRYVWGGPWQVGFMADEVKRVMPDAVVSRHGYDMVDYGKVLEAA